MAIISPGFSAKNHCWGCGMPLYAKELAQGDQCARCQGLRVQALKSLLQPEPQGFTEFWRVVNG